MNVYIAKMTVPDPCTAIVPFNHGQSTAAKPKLSPINILRWGGGESLQLWHLKEDKIL